MKAAIIGANGFVGTRLVEMIHLGSGDLQALPIVRKPSSLAPLSRFSLEWKVAGALDEADLTAALKGCDAVIHSAIGDPRQIAEMPGVLCRAAAAAGIKRVVYLSSASVHGQAPAPGTTETTELQLGQAMEYNNAKVRAEKAFFEHVSRLGLEGFALRPGVVYGPRSRWISDLADDLRTGRAWLYKNGDGICNGIYVDNLNHAIFAALRAPGSASGAYLVSDAETVTWRDFYAIAANAIGVPVDQITRLESLPAFTVSVAERIKDIAAGPFAQALLPFVPRQAKQITKRLLEKPAAPVSAWKLPSRPSPRITQELALLHQCRWKFPNDKAAGALGYVPPVTFAEGMRRSLAWLAFATPGLTGNDGL